MIDVGEGSVTPHTRRDGTVVWRARLSIYGERYSLGYFDTEEDAWEAIDRKRDAVAALGRGKGLTLDRWGLQWLDRREKDPVHRASRLDRSVWRTHVATAHFYRWPLKKIRRSDVVRWVRDLEAKKAQTVKKMHTTGETILTPTDRPLSTSAMNNALSLLTGCLGDALDEGRGGMKANPAVGIRIRSRPQKKQAWTYLEVAEIEALFALPLRPKQRAIYSVAIFSGLRLGEILGLRWSDIELTGDRPHISVARSYRKPTKSGKPRLVPLFGVLIEELRQWREHQPGVGDALVFRSERSGGMHGRDYTAKWPKVVRAVLGRHVRFHDLRHTCASHLVMGSWGRPWRLEEVRQMLGHSSITVTERYAHLAPEVLWGLASETAPMQVGPQMAHDPCSVVAIGEQNTEE